ncbi:MAG: hypothetical protein K6G07_01355 [Lachnospiraceae bacterium]|nr:hypothetical protein [Lachnospiraceae bacterium]
MEEKMEDRELMEQMLKELKNQKKSERITMIFTVAIFLLFTVVAVLVVPPLLKTVNNANVTLSKLDTAVESLTETSEAMNELVGANSETITEAVESLSNIDFDGLNAGIRDLQDTVGPLADMMNSWPFR